jgi:hypothetical protein
MGFFRYRKEKLLPVLVNRTVIFFFLTCLLTLFFYIAGTVQNFIDSTQLTLLKLYTVLGVFLTVSSLSGIILAVLRYIRMKKLRYLLRAGAYALLTFFALATVLAAVFIIALSEGNT